MTDIYPATKGWLGFQKESAIRTPPSGFDTAMTSTLYRPPTWVGLDLPMPQREVEGRHMGGSRDVNLVSDHGFPIGDGSLEFEALEGGNYWAYALGDTAADSGASPALTHTVTARDVLDTFALHYHTEDVAGSNDIDKNFLGCHVKAMSTKLEMNGEITHSVGLNILKQITGTASLTEPTAATGISAIPWEWKHILVHKTTGTNLLYDSNADAAQTNIFGVDSNDDLLMRYCDSIEVSVENDLEFKHPGGDSFARIPMVGKRTHKVAMHLYPVNTTLMDIRDKISYPTSTPDADYYNGDLDFIFKISKTLGNDTQSMTWTYNKLRVTGYSPIRLPSIDDKAIGIDLEMELSPTGSLSFVSIDDLLGSNFYPLA